MGQLNTDFVTRSPLFILAQASSPYPDTKGLLSAVHSYYYALLVQGVGYARGVANFGGIMLAGHNSTEGRRVSQLGFLPIYHEPNKFYPEGVSESNLKATPELCRGIDAIYANQQGPDYLTLRKGFGAFLDAIQHDAVHHRLHQFTRAIEAVIRQRRGKGTKDFIGRCQYFAGSRPDDVKLLGEIYELRSAAEHLAPMSDKLSTYPAHEHDDIKRVRAYQAELLAGFVYRKILAGPTILPTFQSDQSTADLWAKPKADLISFWGNTIDLHNAWQSKFHDNIF